MVDKHTVLKIRREHRSELVRSFLWRLTGAGGIFPLVRKRKNVAFKQRHITPVEKRCVVF